METTAGRGGRDLDLHSAISGDDGEYATDTVRTDAGNGGAQTLDKPSLTSSHESETSLYLTNYTPEQRQWSITPNNFRKRSSNFWEINVSDSGEFINPTPSPSSVHQQDQVLNQKSAHGEDQHAPKITEVGNSNLSNCDSRNIEADNVERESQTYTASNSVENSSMASPALESSAENNHPNENLPSQHPSTQVMKHPKDSASSSSYRIPSHVFARQTTTPMEWSVASNESLFSIPSGNMSFSRDMYLFGKNYEFDESVERNMRSNQTNISGPLADVSSNQSSLDQISNSICVTPDDSTTTTTKAKAEETMREVIRENTEHLRGTAQVVAEMKPSRRSDANKQSFAFPILTDEERNSSAKLNQDKHNKEVQTQPQTAVEPPNEVQEPKTADAGSYTTSRWFSCFCCCCS